MLKIKQKWLIVVIALILGGTVFTLVSKMGGIFIKDRNQDNMSSMVVAGSAQVLTCRDGWQKYQQDVIGIAFCYPVSWGAPNTSPMSNITRLSQMKEDYAAQNIYYDNAFDIVFEKNDKVRLHLFNDQYDGKADGLNRSDIYYESGATDDVDHLKNDGNICGYKIMYDHGLNGEKRLLQTVYSECSNAVKTVLTRDDDFSSTYKLKLLSFAKLSNGYFNDILVSRSVGSLDQVSENNIRTLEEFFSGMKAHSERNLLTMKNRFEQDRNEFSEFVGTITAFKPIPKAQTDFQSVDGEDSDISVIRRYYWYIASGKLDEAYALYANKKDLNLDAFKVRYKNAYAADPIKFKKVGDHIYEFQVKYRDHNAPEQKYNVIMNVNNGVVRTMFLEEVQSDISSFGNMAAYAVRRAGKNYVILKKDGREIIIDQGDAKYDSEYKNISSVKFFADIKFSPHGNYLTYTMHGWEWSIGYIYDITKEKMVTFPQSNVLDSAYFDFTPDEQHFYVCSSAGMSSGPGGSVYTVPGFQSVYDIQSDPRSRDFLSVDCSYDQAAYLILFNLSDYQPSYLSEGELPVQEKRKQVLKYNMVTGKSE